MLIFNSLENYDQLPDLSQFGMRRLWTTDRAFARQISPGKWDTSQGDEPSTRAMARDAAAQQLPLCLDIENAQGPTWRFDQRSYGQSAMVQSIARLSEIIDWTRDERACMRLGWYGDGFADDYWAPVNADPKIMGKWLNAHDQLRSRMLYKFDFVAPSLYAFYDDLAGWKKYAQAVLDNARKWGVQVYPFLWPEFHDSSKLAGQFIPPQMWQGMLDFVFTRVRNVPRADAVVIWSGGPRKQWRDDAPWWQITKQYLPATQAAA